MVRVEIVCPVCLGNGTTTAMHLICPTCNGTGKIANRVLYEVV